jgi:ABC-type polysaccharide/polyol phosphate export permease
MSSFTFTTFFDSKINESYFKFVSKSIRDLYTYRFAIANFVNTNLRMRYRRSTLGFVWTVLNPLLTMSVLSLVFSIIFKRDVRVFSIYIFSGLAPYGFINAAVQAGGQSLIHAEGFLKKVYLPKMMFPVITVMTETVNFIFSMVTLYLIGLMLGSELSWRLLLLPLALILTFIFILALVLILSVATVYFRDLTQIVSVLFATLQYTVPIVYPIETIPEQYRIFFYINPLFYYITLYRKIFYNLHVPMTLMDWVIPTSISLVLLAVGMFVLFKRNHDIIYRL